MSKTLISSRIAMLTLVIVTLSQPYALAAGEESWDVSFAGLNFPDRVLRAPYGTAYYYFSPPAHWEILPGSYLELDLLYEIADPQVARKARPAEVEIWLDGSLLDSLTLIDAGRIRHRVELPTDLSPRSQLEVRFIAHTECESWGGIALTIKDSSVLHFVYVRRPLPLDLADFPRPFYQRSFAEPDGVLIVIPSAPTAREAATAAIMAATLGQRTAARVPISVTTDIALDPALRAERHLIVIGAPQRNSLVNTLVTTPTSPVNLYTPQVTLTASAPTFLPPERPATYTFAISPSASSPPSALLSVSVYPSTAWATDCRPECTWQGDNTLLWEADGRSHTFTLTLRPPAEAVSNTITLVAALLDGGHRPLAALTLTGTVAAGRARRQVTADRLPFFVVDGQPIAQGDGILGEMISPWNPARAVLLVTGMDDQKAYKAALALSAAPSMPGLMGNTAAVSAVRSPTPSIARPFSTTLTLADLGYEDQTVVGAHDHEIEYRFEIPLGAVLTEQATLHLRFRHTKLISPDQSSITIELNRKPLDSAPLTQETADGAELSVRLPASLAYSGRSNRLLVKIRLEPLDPCVDPSAEYFWFTVAADSYLELPYRSVNVKSLWDLDFYPFPFGGHSNLRDVTFVLPSSPTADEVETMVHLAADLGDAADGHPLAPAVILGRPQEGDLAGRHIIVIGRPTRNALLREINDQLPQPFVPGSDQIEQVLDRVVLRLPPDLSLGYLQLVPSPWDDEHALLAVTGTTDEGVRQAARALTDPHLLWRLKGNLALVRDSNITTADTRALTSDGVATLTAGAVPEMSPNITVTVSITPTVAPTTTLASQTPLPTRTTASRPHPPGWLPLFVGATVVAIALILGIAFWQSRRHSRSP